MSSWLSNYDDANHYQKTIIIFIARAAALLSRGYKNEPVQAIARIIFRDEYFSSINQRHEIEKNHAHVINYVMDSLRDSAVRGLRPILLWHSHGLFVTSLQMARRSGYRHFHYRRLSRG
jgi:hypothetical protein